MGYRYYKVIATIAVEQWSPDLMCDEHKFVQRSGVDSITIDDDDLLLHIEEYEVEFQRTGDK